MREIGIHLRLTTTLIDLFNKAVELQLPAFQCFFVHQDTRLFFRATAQEIQACAQLASSFENLYLHGSYAINLASIHSYRQKSFERELRLAQEIGFTHFILHPGSSKGALHREQAIEALAQAIDEVLEKKPSIQLVLENAAHGGMAIGGDLQDFALLKSKMDHADQLQFCIDTAHAYSYGYDIATPEGQKDFVTLVDNTMGLHNISLIHLNDTTEKCGSKIDRHSIVGQGNLGQKALQEFIMNPAFVNTPLILELPLISPQEEIAVYDLVKQWVEKGEK